MSESRTRGFGFNNCNLDEAISMLGTLYKQSQEEEIKEAWEEAVIKAQDSESTAKVAPTKMINLLTIPKARAAEPSSCAEERTALSFSDVDFDRLEDQLKIFPLKSLVRRANHANRVAESVSQGDGKYMTSKDMYRHLDMLENMVPRTNEAGARLWIETIFFRVSAMLSSGKRMVLGAQQHIPGVKISAPSQTGSLISSGTIDYVALATDTLNHGMPVISIYYKWLTLCSESLLESCQVQYFKRENPNAFVVTEAKQDPEGDPLVNYIPQAVAKMYAFTKYLNKRILRGAITNGHEWIFLIFYLAVDGIGGTYARSPSIKINVSDTYPYKVQPLGPDIIAGILSHWLEHSFVDLDENDWFAKNEQ